MLDVQKFVVHQRHLARGANHNVLEWRRFGQDLRTNGLHGPHVFVRVRESERVWVAVLGNPPQEIDHETLGVDGRLVVEFLALERRAYFLQDPQNRLAKMLHVRDEANPLASIPQQVYIPGGQCFLCNAHAGGGLVSLTALMEPPMIARNGAS